MLLPKVIDRHSTAFFVILYVRLTNEWLVRDTGKKIRAGKRSKVMSGKPVTSKPVYGYLMDEDENFIMDEEAAPVVKQIYSLCLAGNGPTKIARMLTEQQIPTPGEAPQTGNRNLLFFRRQGRVARRIKPDLSGSQPARERQNFFTFLLFLLLLYPT